MSGAIPIVDAPLDHGHWPAVAVNGSFLPPLGWIHPEIRVSSAVELPAHWPAAPSAESAQWLRLLLDVQATSSASPLADSGWELSPWRELSEAAAAVGEKESHLRRAVAARWYTAAVTDARKRVQKAVASA